MNYVSVLDEHGTAVAVIAFLASILGGALSALITSWITYRHERRIENGKKALEIYDKCLEILGLFRKDPSLALDNDYYIELMGLSTKVKAYGGEDVSNAMSMFLDSLEAHHQRYEDAIAEIDVHYLLSEHEMTDPVTGEVETVSEAPSIKSDQYEALIHDARSVSTPTHEKAAKYVDPVIEAIRKSLRPKLSNKGF